MLPLKRLWCHCELESCKVKGFSCQREKCQNYFKIIQSIIQRLLHLLILLLLKKWIHLQALSDIIQILKRIISSITNYATTSSARRIEPTKLVRSKKGKTVSGNDPVITQPRSSSCKPLFAWVILFHIRSATDSTGQFVQVKIIHEFEYESLWSDQLLAFSVSDQSPRYNPPPSHLKLKHKIPSFENGTKVGFLKAKVWSVKSLLEWGEILRDHALVHIYSRFGV